MRAKWIREGNVFHPQKKKSVDDALLALSDILMPLAWPDASNVGEGQQIR